MLVDVTVLSYYIFVPCCLYIVTVFCFIKKLFYNLKVFMFCYHHYTQRIMKTQKVQTRSHFPTEFSNFSKTKLQKLVPIEYNDS